MSRFLYKGFLVIPSPSQLSEADKWSQRVLIKKYHASESLVCPFMSDQTFAKKTDAAIAAGQFGKDIIDGKVPGCSVVELL